METRRSQVSAPDVGIQGVSLGNQLSSRAGAIAKRSWWIVAVVALATACVALVWSLLQTPEYRATATLYVTSGSDADAQSAYQGNLASQQRVASYVELVKSDSVLESALARSSTGLTLDEAKRSVSAAAVPDTVLIAVSAEDQDPSLARQLADAMSTSIVQAVSALETPAQGREALAKVTVVSPARVADGPVSPRIARNVGLGLLVGALIGGFMAYVRHRLDNRVRTEADVSEIVGVPNLSSIPYDRSLNDGVAVDFFSGASPPAEAYRRLRANLQFVSVDDPVRTILITSPSEDEGKTTTALNVATSLAEAGKQVVLVSGDLRKPGLTDLLPVASSVGFTDFLVSSADLEELVQPSGVDKNLFVLSSGALPPNPAELLGSARAGDALALLSRTYDYVIVDSAPVLPVVDSVVLADWVDGVIVVVRSGSTSRKDLAKAVTQLELANLRILGTVLNDVSDRSESYSYSYYGHSSDRGLRGPVEGSKASVRESESNLPSR